MRPIQPDAHYRPMKATVRMKRSKYRFINRFGDFLAERDGGWYCFYCAIPLIRTKSHSSRFIEMAIQDGFGIATIDHCKPLSKGGSNKPENMVLCCYTCNERKGDSDAKIFIRSLKFEQIIKGGYKPNKSQGQRG